LRRALTVVPEEVLVLGARREFVRGKERTELGVIRLGHDACWLSADGTFVRTDKPVSRILLNGRTVADGDLLSLIAPSGPPYPSEDASTENREGLH
jgi:hypothetical protein